MCGEKCTPDQSISEYPFKCSFHNKQNKNKIVTFRGSVCNATRVILKSVSYMQQFNRNSLS